MKYFSVILLSVFSILSKDLYAHQNNLDFTYNNYVRFSSSLSLSPMTDDIQSFVLSPTLEYKHTYDSTTYIYGMGGMIFSSLTRQGFESQHSIIPSNIIIGIGKSFNSKVGNQAAVSLFATIPLALYWSDNIDSKKLAEFSYTSTISSQGWRNPYQWIINSLPLGVNFTQEINVHPTLSIKLNLIPSYIIALNNRPSGFASSQSFDIQYTISDIMIACGMNHYLTTLNLENNDKNQSSIGIGFYKKFTSDVLFFDGNINIDMPNGWTSVTDKTYWGILLGYTYYL